MFVLEWSEYKMFRIIIIRNKKFKNFQFRYLHTSSAKLSCQQNYQLYEGFRINQCVYEQFIWHFIWQFFNIIAYLWVVFRVISRFLYFSLLNIYIYILKIYILTLSFLSKIIYFFTTFSCWALYNIHYQELLLLFFLSNIFTVIIEAVWVYQPVWSFELAAL